MRKPKVKNKYNLKPTDIKKLKVLKKDRIHESPFWRNDAVGAWCLSDTTCKSAADDMFCTYDSYWIGFYDEDAKAYAGKIRFECTSYGGMCGYVFKKFFDPEEIENEIDLEIQEKLVSRLNWLIEEGIVEVRR